MKAVFLIPALICGVMVMVFLLGPRYVIKKAPTKIPNIPEDLDAFIETREDGIPDLKEGIRKTILWAHEDKQKTPFSVVYIHGFSSSRKELSPFAEKLADEIGANLFMTRLKGHGTISGEAMGEVGPTDWMRDTLEAAAIGEKIGDKVIVVGTSHGGLLATWLASVADKFPNLHAQILISPNYGPVDKRTLLLSWPWAAQILPPILGEYKTWEPQNSGHEYYWNIRYPTRAVLPLMAQVNYVRENSLPKVKIPTLVFYSSKDQTVDPALLLEGYEALGASVKKIIPVEDSGDKKHHILAGDILSPNTTEGMLEASIDFLKQL
jgi:esterase/lipase